MTGEEHETNINFDYSDGVIRIYTTRLGVYSRLIKRLGDEALGRCQVEQMNSRAWQMTIPMDLCRDASMVVKLTNPDEKTEMPSGVFDRNANDTTEVA